MAIQTLGPLLSRLVDGGKDTTICFATTNYDRIVEYVSDSLGLQIADGFGGLDGSVAAPWTGEFGGTFHLYKLHGSVTYYGDREAHDGLRYFRLDRGYALPSPDFRLTREGNALEPLMVLPALEKETLDDPYGQLNHRFAEMMSASRVVVAIGTSLRDNDLVSAINYNARKSVVLLVDSDPGTARARIEDVSCVTLKANAQDFLEVSAERLVQLLEDCCDERDTKVVFASVDSFAREEVRKIAQWTAMSEEQRVALQVVQRDSSDAEKMRALQILRGIADSDVVHAVAGMCGKDNSALIRKAAAGCLGLSGSEQAVEPLRVHAINDDSPDVRLEGYLALRELGGKPGLKALDEARARWPGDGYFTVERESTAR